jgi:hypothetical protein
MDRGQKYIARSDKSVLARWIIRGSGMSLGDSCPYADWRLEIGGGQCRPKAAMMYYNGDCYGLDEVGQSMDDKEDRERRRRRKFVKRPLWRRRPELVILVMVAIGLAAVLIVAILSGLLDAVGDTLGVQSDEEPVVVYDAAEQACFEKHPFGLSGLMADFKCDVPCNSCHLEGEF